MKTYALVSKHALRRFENLATRQNWFVLISIINSIRVSLDDYRLTIVFFDGKDWIYRWIGGALVLDNPKYCPKKKLSQDLPLFGLHYTPQPGDVVLDAGAGVGTEIPWLSKGVGPMGKVFAVEADPIASRRLKKLIKLNRFTNVTVYQFALWNKNEPLPWNLDNSEGLRNSVQNSAESKNFVAAITLDELIRISGVKVINYLKMNIEGAEKEVLEVFSNKSIVVKNWCISCHDFIGVLTSEWVEEWMMNSNLEILPNKGWLPRTCESFYRYAKIR